MLIMSQESQIYQESRPKEINFKSNVERAVYEVFNRVCEGLGYDWREYTSDEKYSFFSLLYFKKHILTDIRRKEKTTF